MPMIRNTTLALLTSLLLAMLVCAPALAGQIEGMTVDVGDFTDGHDGDRLVDGNTATAWIGGGRSSGPGKWIELTFPAPVKLKYLSIANGNQARGQFEKNRRITRGFIKYPDDTRQQFTLKDSTGTQRLDLLPKTVDSIKIVILGVVPGSRDKSIGKAKVAVSEISVFGEMDESAIVEDVTEKEPVVVEEKEPEPAKPAPKKAKKAAPAPQPKKKPAKVEPTPKKTAAKTEAKPDPKPKAKTASVPKPKPKPAPAPKPAVKKVTPTKSVAKQKPAPAKAEPKATKPKQAAPKPVAKKTDKKKAAKPKTTAKAKPQHKPSGSATAPGIAYLNAAVQVPESKPFAIGQISPWLNLELVAQVKRYLALLTTLHDSYPDVFVASIRDRERAAFIQFQDQMRANKRFGQHHMAQLDHIGLNFDKPVGNNDAATMRVHGPYRYYIGDTTYEFQVDAVFTLMVEDDKWLLSDVQPR